MGKIFFSFLYIIKLHEVPREEHTPKPKRKPFSSKQDRLHNSAKMSTFYTKKKLRHVGQVTTAEDDDSSHSKICLVLRLVIVVAWKREVSWRMKNIQPKTLHKYVLSSTRASDTRSILLSQDLHEEWKRKQVCRK